MRVWILIVLFSAYDGGADVENIVFKTRQACEAARSALLAHRETPTGRFIPQLFVICVEDDA